MKKRSFLAIGKTDFVVLRMITKTKNGRKL